MEETGGFSWLTYEEESGAKGKEERDEEDGGQIPLHYLDCGSFSVFNENS